MTRSNQKERQLDIRVKRQIFNSEAFRNSMRHYDNNICVQYASEEEYMAMLKLKEQQRLQLKHKLEKERKDRVTSLHPSVITERSGESGSQESLLL